MRASTGERVRLLAHPLVTGSLALLAANDHVLKPWSAGRSGAAGAVAQMFTGKASDLAGVLLVALLTGLLSGRRRQCVVGVALGFTALKLVPAVAILAAPLLGGVTRTDPTDLVALIVLWPAHRLLARPSERQAAIEAHPPVRTPDRASMVARPLLTIVVLGLAVPAVTATSSCDHTEVVDTVGASTDSALYAHIVAGRGAPPDHGSSSSSSSAPTTRTETSGATTTSPSPGPGAGGRWARSADRGRSWAEAAPPLDGAELLSGEHPDSACQRDGTCFRVDGTRVEERRGEGPWSVSFSFSAEQVRRMRLRSNGCGGEPRVGGEFTSVLVVDDVALVTMGSQGLLRRDRDRGWQRVGVTDRQPISLDGPSWLVHLRSSPLVLLVLAPLLLVVSKRRSGRYARGLGAAALALIGAGLAAAWAFYLDFNGGADYVRSGVAIASACVVTFVLSLALAAIRPSSGAPADVEPPWPPSPPRPGNQ